MKRAGFKIYTWTVNDPKDIQKMLALEVDAIISDFPERIKAFN
jgi:glycerophosphoryl diester phosphodiesterase